MKPKKFPFGNFQQSIKITIGKYIYICIVYIIFITLKEQLSMYKNNNLLQYIILVGTFISILYKNSFMNIIQIIPQSYHGTHTQKKNNNLIKIKLQL